MPRLDKKVELNTTVEKIYAILDDFMTLPRWNITVNGIEELEKDKYKIASTVGDVTNTVIENVPNEKMTSKQEDSPMLQIGYLFEPKGDKCVVTLWTEYELEDQESVLDIAAELFLKSMKVYVDYLESGGEPEAYKKKFSAIRKAQI